MFHLLQTYMMKYNEYNKYFSNSVINNSFRLAAFQMFRLLVPAPTQCLLPSLCVWAGNKSCYIFCKNLTYIIFHVKEFDFF